ncbi:MAG: aminotransferase class I/II-fold pyridoxal phosphate-dependent enzyme, partial [Simplicispira sp.]|nr:aminotransferase class I/II-fold pyridoxal phosphate-dependent enzyme [Simplicispira sp.]
SSFSKTLSADLRVGYIAAATHRINALCDIKMVTVVSTSEFVERVVQQLLSSGQYWRHLSRLRERINEALGPGQKALERLGLTVHHSQSGGYYLWVELPQG